ncbi:E22 family MetX-like putative esterase [Rhodovibrio salinarum]|uniref:Probable acyltransferase n=1 Tax=Rhodovibrio salinarum TaxID=1087 RepID=A0A934QGP7_9PROT|nr:homoserine O-acetyltransferase [Rhodovibrio salinarum]MBK1696468.1 homoserine acetyltransferase [Rhodovibrio salinarum]
MLTSARVTCGVAMASMLAAIVAGGTPAAAYEPIVEKKTFTMKDYTTVNGAPIPEVRVGWEAYGSLNEARDNVIVIPHFFSGTSHAAGRYSEEGARGYWDSIIGSGKPIDTDKYYVISVDSLVNLNVGSAQVVTTGPASINPETGEPYGMDFPIVEIGDFVRVQRRLLANLGIEKVHAVMGASMGALQAYDWAARYPDMVERVIPVIGNGFADPFLIGWLDIWAQPIRLDPNWNGGDYYGGDRPKAGLAAALKTVTLHAQNWPWAQKAFGRKWAAKDADPAKSFDNRYAVEAALDKVAKDRASSADANHFLYLVKANQLFIAGDAETPEAGLKAIDAPTLMLQAQGDLVFFPGLADQTQQMIESDGTPVARAQIPGDRGHLNGVLNIQSQAEKIRDFLNRTVGE